MSLKYGLAVAFAALCLIATACGRQAEPMLSGGKAEAPQKQEVSTSSAYQAKPATAEVLAEKETAAEGSSLQAGNGVVSAKNALGVYLADTEAEVVAAINAERKAQGLEELTINEKLTQAARIRSEELFRTGHWDHTRPNGDSWSTVLQEDVPFSYSAAGENLATVKHNDTEKRYEADANWWFTEWKNSPGHYENMIRAEFCEVGVGIYFEEQADGLRVAYATTLFANTEQ